MAAGLSLREVEVPLGCKDGALILMVEGAWAVSSLAICSLTHVNLVVLPESTSLEYRSFLISTSRFMIAWEDVSWMLLSTISTRLGWKSTSGQR